MPGYEAPVYVAWSRRNRSALIRIPLYKPGAEQATRAEIRCPDPACNPYLTFAALLHAGLEGIEKGYELPDPMETNLYHLTAEQRRGARHRLAAGDARRGDRRALAVGARAQGARPAHLRPLRRDQAQGVGRVPRAADELGDGALPRSALEHIGLPERGTPFRIVGRSARCGLRSRLTADYELLLWAARGRLRAKVWRLSPGASRSNCGCDARRPSRHAPTAAPVLPCNSCCLESGRSCRGDGGGSGLGPGSLEAARFDAIEEGSWGKHGSPMPGHPKRAGPSRLLSEFLSSLRARGKSEWTRARRGGRSHRWRRRSSRSCRR